MTYNRVRSGIIASNIVIMYKQRYGHVDPIKCAPNRYALKEFGGTLTIEEFRKITQNGPRVTVHMPDEVHTMQTVVRSDIKCAGMSEKESDSKFREITGTNTTNETLKIKRPKPLKRDMNNLEMTLGITRKK
jgi:hypothetical protein